MKTFAVTALLAASTRLAHSHYIFNRLIVNGASIGGDLHAKNITVEPEVCQRNAVPNDADYIILEYGVYCDFFPVSNGCQPFADGGPLRWKGPITNIPIMKFHGKDFECGTLPAL
ncbi:hypothetical protein BU23DRAFT_568744 [Bimuria novae-zelandiae CBS 107.79]|uniref:Uncharacterized protein n=1 Tax=Bimuria novae-zelandiae CBS 107.79 TaxID=1447943 RepID=A0A6A5V6S2_9PLEO|nr:hypothetical protein BU23DRAFT_568744 [Bimuria novae-zelandiae CBS 107.79]